VRSHLKKERKKENDRYEEATQIRVRKLGKKFKKEFRKVIQLIYYFYLRYLDNMRRFKRLLYEAPFPHTFNCLHIF
jgi:hypothetical protein